MKIMPTKTKKVIAEEIYNEIQAAVLLNQAEIMVKQMEQDEVMAMLLSEFVSRGRNN